MTEDQIAIAIWAKRQALKCLLRCKTQVEGLSESYANYFDEEIRIAELELADLATSISHH